MNFTKEIAHFASHHLHDKYDAHIEPSDLLFNETRKEFEGDITLVLFPLLKSTKSNPATLGESLGNHIVENIDHAESYNIVKGFLNIKFSNTFWLSAYKEITAKEDFTAEPTGKKIIVEFSSPNTNKPLHLGHMRNILLGWSCSQILEAAGNEVIKTQIVNDRGIAICKSMLAWQKFGHGETPESTNTKSDHFVGQYYVKFEQEFAFEYKKWQESEEGLQVYNSLKKEDQDNAAFFKEYKNTYFNENSLLGKEAKTMLLAWEDNDPAVRELWMRMNQWVYDGFDETYKKLGVTFDTMYYESETYKLGKDIINEGIAKNHFFTKEDGSVWINLEEYGLDHKLVLRSDGTSVYMTQDLGTAQQRYKDTGADGMVYVVADEQNYHFSALFAILKKLEEKYSTSLHHLSYGMVDLPSGRMKSREGKVVDADDLLQEVIEEARKNAQERGEIEDISEAEREEIYTKIGIAALKFFILKVNPKKRMVFNPEESVDMQGTTGPYVQNAYVRIQSICRKSGKIDKALAAEYTNPENIEIDIIKKLLDYENTIQAAAEQYDPSLIAVYCYELAKSYHRFYNDVRILGAENETDKAFRVQLGINVAKILKDGFRLIGIDMPNRM